MDIRKVKKLIELLEASGVTEIEVCEGEESVRISRQTTTHGTQTIVHVPDMPPPVQATEGSPAASIAGTAAADAPAEEGHLITSPMVGIFYAALAPGEPAFVTVGQSIKTGDVVCVLEAMKIMNQIESDVSGTVTRVHVSNGEAVEYGQPLFTVSEDV